MGFMTTVAKVIVKAIGNVWSFATIMAFITALATFILFTLTIVMPENVAKAIEIIKSLGTEVEIVASG